MEIEKEPEPESGPPFRIEPGRYYLAMWYFDMPERQTMFGKGGNMLLLCWRKDDEPDKWYVLFRFRHYRNEKIWDHDDVMNWKMMTIKVKNEADIEATLDRFYSTITPFTSVRIKVEKMAIHGDCNKFREVMEKEKPDWMQFQGAFSA